MTKKFIIIFAICFWGPVWATEFLDPYRAVEWALSEPLQLVGKTSLYGIEPSKSCIFRNSNVTVVHTFCKPIEASAAQVYIYSADEGVVKFYVEATRIPPNIEKPRPSTVQRPAYDNFWWKISYSPFPLDASIPFQNDLGLIEFASFYKSWVTSNHVSYCLYSDKVRTCSENLSSLNEDWTHSAGTFWNEPPQKWYDLLLELKRLSEQVNTSPVAYVPRKN